MINNNIVVTNIHNQKKSGEKEMKLKYNKKNILN